MPPPRCWWSAIRSRPPPSPPRKRRIRAPCSPRTVPPRLPAPATRTNQNRGEDAMHLGATLRLLRVDAGLSLRDLARRIGVSSAYLSRVENGLDAVPTPERLAAIARELDVPSTLLMDVAHRVSPFVASYLEQVPGAGRLFLE